MAKTLNKEEYMGLVEKAAKLAENKEFMFVASVFKEKIMAKSSYHKFDKEAGHISAMEFSEIPEEKEHYKENRLVDMIEELELNEDELVVSKLDEILDYIENKIFKNELSVELSLTGIEVGIMLSEDIKAIGANTGVVINKINDNEYKAEIVFEGSVKNLCDTLLIATDEQEKTVWEALEKAA